MVRSRPGPLVNELLSGFEGLGSAWRLASFKTVQKSRKRAGFPQQQTLNNCCFFPLLFPDRGGVTVCKDTI